MAAENPREAPPNGIPPVTKVDQVNQLVRAGVVIVLTTAFSAGFLSGLWRETPLVTTGEFVGILAVAITWLFKSRDEQQRRSDILGMTPTTTTKTQDTTVVTAPTPPPGG